MKITVFIVMILHFINALQTLMNLCGLEKRLCGARSACLFFAMEFTILVYMQVDYFSNLSVCQPMVPMLIFWLLLQIFFFYFVVVLLICFIFRKFCNPDDDCEREEKLGEINEKKDQVKRAKVEAKEEKKAQRVQKKGETKK